MLISIASLSLLPLAVYAAPAFNTETIHGDAAPILTSSTSETIPDSYIVVFKKHITESSAVHHHKWVQDVHMNSENVRLELRKRSQFPLSSDIFAGIKHTYNVAGNFLGYSGHFDESVIEQVRRHPDVSNTSCNHLHSSSKFFSKSFIFLRSPMMVQISSSSLQTPYLGWGSYVIG